MKFAKLDFTGWVQLPGQVVAESLVARKILVLPEKLKTFYNDIKERLHYVAELYSVCYKFLKMSTTWKLGLLDI